MEIRAQEGSRVEGSGALAALNPQTLNCVAVSREWGYGLLGLLYRGPLRTILPFPTRTLSLSQALEALEP